MYLSGIIVAVTLLRQDKEKRQQFGIYRGVNKQSDLYWTTLEVSPEDRGNDKEKRVKKTSLLKYLYQCQEWPFTQQQIPQCTQYTYVHLFTP
jgi:hypothetical protein